VPSLDTPGSANSCDFGSAHVAGCNMAYGDGSVHLVSYQVNAALFLAWGTRSSPLPGDISAD
jgi:prepilin-type processing-associated H-X9-DG protein